jgi:hypothetical protein
VGVAAPTAAAFGLQADGGVEGVRLMQGLDVGRWVAGVSGCGLVAQAGAAQAR